MSINPGRPEDHLREDMTDDEIDRWFSTQHELGVTDLSASLNLEAGLEEILLVDHHTTMTAKLAEDLDLHAGLAAILETNPAPGLPKNTAAPALPSRPDAPPAPGSPRRDDRLRNARLTGVLFGMFAGAALMLVMVMTIGIISNAQHSETSQASAASTSRWAVQGDGPFTYQGASGRDDNAVHGGGLLGAAQVGAAQGGQDPTRLTHMNSLVPVGPIPSAGAARIRAVRSMDGQPGDSNRVKVTVNVTALPRNGNTLFLVCDLQGGDQHPHHYYGKTEITVKGKTTYPLTFGGNNPPEAIVGSSLVCEVMSVSSSREPAFFFLMKSDSAGFEYHSGTGLDYYRTFLPEDGAVVVSNPVSIRIGRIDGDSQASPHR